MSVAIVIPSGATATFASGSALTIAAGATFTFTGATIAGVMPVANGGTGASTKSAAMNNLLPTQTGNVGKVYTTNGTDAVWQAVGADDITVVSGKTLAIASGASLTISGAMSGAPTGGTLDLSNLTLTLPASVATVGPLFQAYRDTDFSVTGSFAVDLITTFTEQQDTDNCFDPTTGKFTPTKAGLYYFFAEIPYDVAAAPLLQVFLAKNGSALANSSGHQGITDRTLFSASAVVQMNGTTDYMQCAAFGSTAATLDMSVAPAHFYGWFLR